MRVTFKPTGCTFEAEQYRTVPGSPLEPYPPVSKFRLRKPTILEKLKGKKPYYEIYNHRGRWVPTKDGDWFIYLSSCIVHLKPELFDEFFEVELTTEYKVIDSQSV